jgi:hypothetical protein
MRKETRKVDDCSLPYGTWYRIRNRNRTAPRSVSISTVQWYSTWYLRSYYSK